jgi:hypothetical protein
MKRAKSISVKFTKREDIDLLRSRSKEMNLPMTKTIIEAVKMSKEIYLTRGKISTLEFLNRELFRDYFERHKKKE